MVYAIDPDRGGAPLWQYRASEGGVAGGIQWGMAADSKRAYVAVSDMGIKPPAKRVPGGPRYEIDPVKGGGLLALNLASGKLAWRTPAPGCDDRRPCSPAQIAPVTATTMAVYSGSIDGRIRGYSPADGRVLWTFDTVRDFQTVNTVPARGGAIDVSGAVVAGDMVYVMSGYNFLGGMPGNVLLAFKVSQ
jgi:polyvinyl alcohol dehydrogenase (cytochrome)